jgi:predicted GNAT superfamily acetyltransferase
MTMTSPTPSGLNLWAASSAVEFRELTSIEDIRLVQEMERRVWGGEDIDISPVLLMVALIKSGALLLGAFTDGQLRGFAFSVPGDRHGQRLHWSHMTGVDESLRSSGLGTQLKFEQARRVAARGYTQIQWTYDPLQSLNAYLNLVKLGGVAGEYAEHVYGDSNSDLHRGAPTDRFIVTWTLDADGTPRRSTRLVEAARADGEPAGRVTMRDGWHVYHAAPSLPDAPVVQVPIPARFSSMLQEAPSLAIDWRLQTRAQFQALFASGYEAVDFRRVDDRGAYILVR